MDWWVDDIMGHAYQARRVAKAILHPEFGLHSQRYPDVGILILDKAVPVGWPTLTLPNTSTKIPTRLRTLGYGALDEEESDMSQQLRQVAVDFVPQAKCRRLLNKQVRERQMQSAKVLLDCCLPTAPAPLLRQACST